MKTLLVSNMYPSKKNPGYGVFVKNFKDSMEGVGLRFNLSVIQGRPSSRLDKLYKYLLFFIRTSWEISFRKYELIYVHYIAHSLLPLLYLFPIIKFKKTKIICNIHGEDLLPRNKVERFIFRMTKNIVSRSSLIVVPSKHFEAITRKKFPKNKIVISPSAGIDLKVFKPLDKKINNGTFKFGYVSRIDPGKGWDVLLDSALIIQNTKPKQNIEIELVGEGSQVNELLSRIKNLNLENIVRYLGPMQQSDLPKFYSSLDAFIFPTTLNESLGLVGIEALACGVPAICSSTGGIKSYIQDGKNGYLFNPGCHLDLARKITLFTTLSSAERESLRERSISMANNFDRKTVANKLIQEIIKSVR